MRRRTVLKTLAGAGMAAAPTSPAAPSARRGGRARTMLDMTFIEFADAVAKSDIALVPVGSVEEHGPYLPLGSDSVAAVQQLAEVQAALRLKGIESLIAPPLNIGITNEGADDEKDGTYIYPGSLAVRAATLERLYVDLIRSLHSNGLRRIFLYSGHLGGKHLTTVARSAESATREIEGVQAWALIDSERLERLPQARNSRVLALVDGLNFPRLTRLLGGETAPRFTTHADGWETSLLLHFAPDVVRPGYQRLPDAPSLPFLQAQEARNPQLNPNGTGGFPNSRASADVGEKIAAERTAKIVAAVIRALTT